MLPMTGHPNPIHPMTSDALHLIKKHAYSRINTPQCLCLFLLGWWWKIRQWCGIQTSLAGRLWRQRHRATWPVLAQLIGVQQGSEQSLGNAPFYSLVLGTGTNSHCTRPTFSCFWNYCFSSGLKSQHPSEFVLKIQMCFFCKGKWTLNGAERL